MTFGPVLVCDLEVGHHCIMSSLLTDAGLSYDHQNNNVNSDIR